jgi:hypothetical protein
MSGSVKRLKRRRARGRGDPHAGFLSPSFLMRETKVLGLILSNSAAPPGEEPRATYYKTLLAQSQGLN